MSSEEVDHCVEDPMVPGQVFVCLSVVHPELSVAERRAMFLARRFVGNFMSKEVKAVSAQASSFIVGRFGDRLEAFKAQLAEEIAAGEAPAEHRVALEWLRGKLARMLPSEEDILAASTRTVSCEERDISDAYVMWHAQQADELEREAAREIGALGKVTVAGVKVRGSYGTEEAARKRAAFLQSNVEPAADVFVGEVGKWLPLTPNVESVEDQQYAQRELNLMVGQMRERQIAAEQFQKQRREASKKQATAVGASTRMERARANARLARERRARERALLAGGGAAASGGGAAGIGGGAAAVAVPKVEEPLQVAKYCPEDIEEVEDEGPPAVEMDSLLKANENARGGEQEE